MRKAVRSTLATALAGIALLMASAGTLAHDIPARTEIHSFVKQDSEELQVLMRLPLSLLLNVNLPKRGPGYLDLVDIESDLERAAGIVARELPFYANGRRLSPVRHRTQLALPSSDAFGSYERALEHLANDLPSPDTNIFWNQGYFDIHLSYPLPSDEARIAFDMILHPGLAGQINLILEFQAWTGEVTSYVLHHGMGLVTLNPNRADVAQVFSGLGFSYPLYSAFHLVFLLCLLLPFGTQAVFQQALIIVLFALAQGLAIRYFVMRSLPITQEVQALVEFVISLLLVLMAIQNIVARKSRHRWLSATACGLILGLLFVNELRSDMQLAGGYGITALLFFNLGTLIALAALVIAANPVVRLLHRTRRSSHYSVLIISALIMHAGGHWLIDRFFYLKRNWAFISWRFSVDDVLFTAFFLMLTASIVWFAYRVARKLRLARSG